MPYQTVTAMRAAPAQATIALDTRGAGLLEYLVLVGLVAIAGTAAFKAFGGAALDKALAHAECVASFDCAALPPVALEGVQLDDPGPMASGDAEPPPIDGIPEDADYLQVDGDVTVVGEGDGTAVHPSDVDQGGLGDCYLIAALGALAAQEPGIIEDAIVDNGDGTYTITFHEPNPHPGWQLWASDWREVEITITDEFPVSAGSPVFAHPGDGSGDHIELWAMLIEKAYAQWRGGYDDIGQGGSPAAVMTALTGQPSESTGDELSLDSIADAFEGGEAIVLATPKGARTPLFEDGTLVGQHAYFVTGVDRDAQTITLHNPWSWDKPAITVTYEQYLESFSTTYTNPADD